MTRKLHCALVAVAALLAPAAHAAIISNFAGGGGAYGDGGPAIDALLQTPQGIAVDLAGNVYFADNSAFVIRRVDGASGIITTVAGNGEFGYSGDGGPATAARLSTPLGVAVDAVGNVFVADQLNGVVRRVDFSNPSACAYDGDIFPCGSGNGTVDLDDILAVLDAFGANYACPPS